MNTSKFPDGITNTVQYGEKVKSAAVYLTQYQLIPYKGCNELIEDLFGIGLSQGTIVNLNNKCHEELETIEANIKDSITNNLDAVHFDETGIYIDKKRQWLHVASNDNSILLHSCFFNINYFIYKFHSLCKMRNHN
ncbi:IS66 family transposase [Clostridium saccharobutylicum]|uniref:Transposase IS66 family protein n=1 Tax=Clostridium saccharobutylicum TaxID=169679 RepID=A0A1S8N687_CLOSA|nr:transposase [Clostridium saccharobutylicum]OOM11957.1 transposase IS66 family protein [Clostridium saccharobutylicum]